MNARDPSLPLLPDQTSALAAFANAAWDREIVPAITDYIGVPAKSPMFDADWQRHGHLDRVIRDAATWVEGQRIAETQRTDHGPQPLTASRLSGTIWPPSTLKIEPVM